MHTYKQAGPIQYAYLKEYRTQHKEYANINCIVFMYTLEASVTLVLISLSHIHLLSSLLTSLYKTD